MGSDSKKMHLQVKKLNLDIFTCVPLGKNLPQFLSSHLLLFRQRKVTYSPQAGFFQKSVSEKGGETMICFFKLQSENITMAWNIRLYILYDLIFSNVIFYVICNFCKCNYFTVLKKSLSYSMVLILLSSPICNLDNLILKLN